MAAETGAKYDARAERAGSRSASGGIMQYDYLVIGSGAGGCAAAYRLGLAGKRVLVLEKGPALPRDGSTLDCDKVIRQGLFKNTQTWRDRRGKRLVPDEYFNVGGKTKWYGAALLRFAEHEFRAEPRFQCLGWPLSYADLEPYYRQAEALLGVRRFEVEADLVEFARRIEAFASGWRSAALPLALHERILQHPQEAAHFDGFASALGLKADGPSLLQQLPAEAAVEVRVGQPVCRLLGEPGRPQRVAGVELEDGSRFTAKQVVLAAGAMHSPRLLQAYLQCSGLDEELPSARLVGRFFKRHLLTAVLAFSAVRKTDRLRKTLLWLNDDFPHSSVQPLGFGPDALAALLPRCVPKVLARFLCRFAYGFFLQTEDGSHLDNRIDAQSGQPLPTLDYDPARLPVAQREHKGMVKHFCAVLRRAGYLSVSQAIPLTGTAHACGTLICGRDPRGSVVDGYGRVHGFDNLSVVDGSVLPRSSRVNPALTIYAFALRAAEHWIGTEIGRN